MLIQEQIAIVEGWLENQAASYLKDVMMSFFREEKKMSAQQVNDTLLKEPTEQEMNEFYDYVKKYHMP